MYELVHTLRFVFSAETREKICKDWDVAWDHPCMLHVSRRNPGKFGCATFLKENLAVSVVTAKRSGDFVKYMTKPLDTLIEP